MTAAPSRHCPGCNGFGKGWEGDCPGVSLTDGATSFHIHHVLAGLSLLMRIRILLGLPARLCIQSGPGFAADVTDLLAAGDNTEFGPDNLLRGPWKEHS